MADVNSNAIKCHLAVKSRDCLAMIARYKLYVLTPNFKRVRSPLDFRADRGYDSRISSPFSADSYMPHSIFMTATPSDTGLIGSLPVRTQSTKWSISF